MKFIWKGFVNTSVIKFAPLNVPLYRRLQTLAAAIWITMTIFGETIFLLLTIMLIRSDYYYLILIYIFIIGKNRDICNYGGSRWKWARQWKFWEYFRDYFPLKLVKTHDLDPKRNYLLCLFPHGIASTGCFFSFATAASGFEDLFPGMTSHMLTLGGRFLVPFYRELGLWLGMCSASRESINYLLDPNNGSGKCVTLVVGGTAEALHCNSKEYKLNLKNRKGFIKVAMKNGSALVPVFSFGEIELYNYIINPEGSKIRRLQDWFRRLTGFPPVFLLGRGLFQYSFGILPHRRPVTTVVGRPLEIIKNLDPTDEEMDAVHREFVNRLTELFEEEKYKYLENPNDTRLIIE